MKHIFLFIAIFYVIGAVGQSIVPFSVKEPTRGEVVIYPTSTDTIYLGKVQSKYLTPLGEWAQEGDSFNTTFLVPFAWVNRDVLLHISSASASYSIILNGEEVACNSNANISADFNLTKLIKEGLNTLSIKVSDGSQMALLESWKDGEQPASIGEVYVMSQPTIRVRDVFIKSRFSGSVMNGEVGIVVKTLALNPKSAQIYYELLSPENELIAHGQPEITLDMRGEDTLRFTTIIPRDYQWNLESAKLYTLKLKTKVDGRYAEYMQFRVGFRSVEMHDGGRMAINGDMVNLVVASVEPDISKEGIYNLKEQGYNTLMPNVGVVSEQLFDACNEIGMYVIASAPIDSSKSGESIAIGGNISNDVAWGEEYKYRAESSYHVAKRNPSVIAFSIAANSANGINLYESFLNLKSKGDARPIIYLDAKGEWNSDVLELKFKADSVAIK